MNAKRITILSAAGLVSAIALSGCEKKEAPAPAETAEVQSEPEAPKPGGATESVSAAKPQLLAILESYEKIRAKLAADDVAAIAADVAALKDAASSVEVAAVAKQTKEIAAAAEVMGEMELENPDAVRASFGDVSRSVVALVEAEPSLQHGRHVFECPMAKGYKKWVQPSTEIANPYMGKKMLTCGAESAWRK